MGQPRHPRIKPLTVKSLLTGKPPAAYTVGIGMPLMEALERMREHNVDALAVIDAPARIGVGLAGILSSRSLISKGLLAADFTQTRPVSQFMTACLVSAIPEQEAQACLALMRAEQLDFIPVVEQDAVVGLLSIIELQSAIISQYESIFKAYELDQRIMFLQGTYSC